MAIQPGGKPVIGKFILALMNPGDEVLYPNPGYPIYESQIEFHGGVALPYGYVEGGENFELDLEAMEAPGQPAHAPPHLQQPAEPHRRREQPGGARAGRRVRACATTSSVLCDEAYWDIRYSGSSRSLASLPGMAERSVILYTFSKKFAMTGWRLGAAVGPAPIIDVIAKLNVNDESCSNHFVQYGALEGLTGDQSGPREIVRILKERRDACAALLNQIPGVSCFTPEATFYLYPQRHRAHGAARASATYDELRRAALEETGVSASAPVSTSAARCPARRSAYVRFAYSGISVPQIEEGLGRLKAWAEA